MTYKDTNICRVEGKYVRALGGGLGSNRGFGDEGGEGEKVG